MPNPTTTHDAAQDALREIERTQNVEGIEIGTTYFACAGNAPAAIDIYAEEYGCVQIFESEATKLVTMILRTFPKIREQIKESKP